MAEELDYKVYYWREPSRSKVNNSVFDGRWGFCYIATRKYCILILKIIDL